MAADAPTVFVSYAHESAEHREQVLGLAVFLRDAGAHVVLDVWATGRLDWYSWAIRELTAADHVVVVASPAYRRLGDGDHGAAHRGVQSEVALLRELVHADRATWLPRVLPVLLPGHGVEEIPLFLQPSTASHFPVPTFTASGAADLLRVIFDDPAPATPAVSATPSTSPPPTPPTGGGVTNQVNGTVIGKVVQADTIHGDVHL